MRRSGRVLRAFLSVVLLIVIIGLAAALLRLYLPGRRAAPLAGPALAPRAQPGSPLPPGSSRLVLGEAELTSRLREAVGNQVGDLAVDCRPGILVITGSLRRGAVRLPARVVVEPFVEGGLISVRIREASLGPLPLPSEVSGPLAQRAQQMLHHEQKRIKGLVVDTVEVTDTQIVFTGHFETGRG
jgi:hypothetical protein